MVDFFWTPKEFAEWIRERVLVNDFWLVIWPIGQDAFLSEVKDLEAALLANRREDSLHLFFGSKSLSEPVWRIANESQQINFAESYAIQIVPPVLTEDDQILLLGSMGMLKLASYGDAKKAERLSKLYKGLVTSLKKNSDKMHSVVQRLSSGGQKQWSNIHLGNGVSQTKNIQLKQFVTGSVVFEMRSKSDAL